MTEDENEPLVKQPQQAPKYQELVNTNRDDSVTKDEQKPVVKQSPKSPKMPELVDTHSHDSDNDKPMAHHLWAHQR